jgi:tetratricopeptide (TPR) repeat protein
MAATRPQGRRTISLLTSLLLAGGLVSGAGVGVRSAAAGKPTSALVDSLIAASRSDSARTMIEARLPAARASGDSLELLVLLSRLGRIHAAADHAKEAEPFLRESVLLAEGLGDSAALCMSLRWLGVSVDQLGRRNEAREINLRLRDLARAIGDRKDEAWAIFGLGWQAEQAGDNDEARTSYQEALKIFSEIGESSGEIWAWNGIGSVAQRRGDFDGATEGYRRSMLRAVEVKHGNGELRALNNLGTVEFLRGDPSKALAAFERARDLQLRRGNQREAVIPALNVAICQTHLGRYEEAEEGLRQGITLCVAGGWRSLEISLRSQLARVYFNKKDYPSAARAYRECLAFGETLPLTTRVQISYGLSNALGKMDSSAAGLAVLDAIEESQRGAVGDEMAVYLMGTRGLRNLEMHRPAEALRYLRMADERAARLGLSDARLYALSNAAVACRALGQGDSSLALLERARGVWEAERKVSASPDWREARGALGNMIYTDLAAGWMEKRDGSSERSRLSAAFDRLQTFKARTLLDRMRGPGEDHGQDQGGGQGQAQAQVIGLEKLQTDVLRSDEAFLDCFVGPERSIVVAVTREDARLALLPPESTLVARIEVYREILTAEADGGQETVGGETMRRAARGIDSTLFGGVESLLRGKRKIFVSPDGPLHLIPFGLGEVGDGVNASAPRWIRVPSATVLSVVRAASAEREQPGARRTLAVRGSPRPGGRALEGARAEVYRLARRYRGVDTDLPTQRAGEPAWQGLESYDLIHVAAHARILDQAPWLSSIEIVSGTDSSLTARQVAELRLRASLVVLSSCESAGGKIRSGEGVAGLTSAFLAAGAPAVLSTLWPVDDRVTVGLMDAFYAALSEGRPPGEALAIAQAKIRARPATRAPFYWAGFVMAGDDGIPVVLKRWPSVEVLGGITLGLILVIAGIAAYRRSRRTKVVINKVPEGL